MNAIILAAGMGTRLRPLTNEIPKCLVPVNGVPMVERQIQFLHEVGIRDIVLVSGYKAEKLEYLQAKYHVGIVYNEKYDTCNNIFSLYKVLDKFGDSWVVEGDVFMQENCFTMDIHASTYFAKWHEQYRNEWGLCCSGNGRLNEIVIGDGQGFVMSGISYWSFNDAKVIAEELNHLIASTDYTSLFWDNAVLNVYKRLDVQVNKFMGIYEIDTEEELRKVEETLSF